MTDWNWILIDENKGELRMTERFESKAEAEQWLAANWTQLADEGAASVSLRENGEETYEMSLAPE
ncbi:MAG TPA: hypothetical protein VEV82_05410 [Actinomycetota bacterium]|nr:hypothetical protein [Actinomycetota bacterium]